MQWQDKPAKAMLGKKDVFAEVNLLNLAASGCEGNRLGAEPSDLGWKLDPCPGAHPPSTCHCPDGHNNLWKKGKGKGKG